jgi:hypothetical protein
LRRQISFKWPFFMASDNSTEHSLAPIARASQDYFPQNAPTFREAALANYRSLADISVLIGSSMSASAIIRSLRNL